MNNNNNYPLGDSMGQIDHQTIYTSQGNVIDNDDIISDVVDSNGVSVISDDEEQIRKFIKEAISIDNLVATFNDNAHLALLKLCSLQDNKHPLKKGGMGISYRTDVLIMHCKMAFSAEENIVFDAILGMISSFPENKVYKLLPSTFQKYTKYSDEKYLYKIFKNGTTKLKKRTLTFDIGKEETDELDIPWFQVLRYHGGSKKTDDNAFIEFVPTDFFKDLAICSQLVHGAYGALEVITQLQGKYTIALYWFLESKKGYREHKEAQTGMFRMSLEDIKYQFAMPDSYKANDIKRRALEPARESINAIKECDFTFDFKEQKVNGVIAGYQFTVKPKKYIDSKIIEERMIEEKPTDALYTQIQTFLEASSFNFSYSDTMRIHNKAKECNRDAIYMMQVILAFKQRLDNPNLDKVEEKAKAGYLCKMIEKGLVPIYEKKKNQFTQYQQSEYDYDELEQKLLDN